MYLKYIQLIDNPSNAPIISTTIPTNTPSVLPTANPSHKPSTDVSNTPSAEPTNTPTHFPSNNPTKTPSNIPTKIPSIVPTKTPTITPTNIPSNIPSISPTINDGGLRLFLFPSSVERFHVTRNWNPSDRKWGPQVIDLSGIITYIYYFILAV